MPVPIPDIWVPTDHVMPLGEKIYYNPLTGRFVTQGDQSQFSGADTIESLIGREQRRLDRDRAEREAVKARKARMKDPIPVSVIKLRAIDPQDPVHGDYLFRDYHATNKTPLLSTPDGKPVGFTPSELSKVSIMRPLSDLEWDEARNLLTERKQAHDEVERLMKFAPEKWDTVTDIDDEKRTPVLRLVNDNYAYRNRGSRSKWQEAAVLHETVPYELYNGGQAFRATVWGETYAALAIEDLGKCLINALHPQVTAQATVLDQREDSPTKGQWIYAPYRPRSTEVHGLSTEKEYASTDTSRTTVLIGVSVETITAALASRKAAYEALQQFVDARILDPKAEKEVVDVED